MAFKPGHKKLGGRKKGTPNKETRTFREIVESALNKSIPEELMELYHRIKQAKPIEAAKILEKCLDYSYPKFQSVQLDVSAEVDVYEDLVEVRKKELQKLLSDQI